MKKLLILTVISLFLLSGCIDYSSTVKLNPDGSGTVEETVLVSEMVMQMFNSFAQSFSDSAEEKTNFDIYDETELSGKASEMGEGVKLVKSEAVKKEGKQGYHAVYKFDNINKLKLSDNPQNKIPGTDIMPGAEEMSDFITFNFTKGNPADLEIIFPKDEKEYDEFEEDSLAYEDETEADEEFDEGMWDEQAKQLLQDFKLSMIIAVNGKITHTNATNVNGNTITLMEMDFGKLMENPEKFNELKDMQPSSMQEAMDYLKDVPGFKLELQDKVNVKFR